MVSVDLSASTALLLTVSCCLWNTEGQKYPVHHTNVLSVPNASEWGDWGPISFCYYGIAYGFSLKVEGEQYVGDNTAVNGIRLYCTDGSQVESKVGKWGKWSKVQFCREGFLVAFSLRVEPYKGKMSDDSSVNNIAFKCSQSNDLVGFGQTRGTFGPWSDNCTRNGICGMRTRVEDDQGAGDDTALNDVLFLCC